MVSQSIDRFYKIKNMKRNFFHAPLFLLLPIGIATNNSPSFIAVFVGLTIAFSFKNKHRKNDI
jgi:hypothetical protein